MTLIASLSVNGAPLLIGDVLLSSDRMKGRSVNYPLIGNIDPHLQSAGLSFGVAFKQKVNLVNDRLAVSWSGPLEQAERAVRVLSELRGNLQLADIQAALSAIDEGAIDKLQLIGFLIRGVTGKTVEASQFYLGVPGISVPGIGAVHVAGLGRDKFLALLNEIKWTKLEKDNEYQAAHALLGALTNEEFDSHNNIRDRWGGGFEAVTFSIASGRLEKVGDILHTFWKVSDPTLSTIDFYPRFYKTTYWNDALIVRTARFEEIAKGTFKLAGTEFDIVPPILKEVNDYSLSELEEIGFSYRVLCCHVLVETTDSSGRFIYMEQMGDQPQVLLEARIGAPGRLQVSGELSAKIIEEVGKKIRTNQ